MKNNNKKYEFIENSIKQTVVVECCSSQDLEFSIREAKEYLSEIILLSFSDIIITTDFIKIIFKIISRYSNFNSSMIGLRYDCSLSSNTFLTRCREFVIYCLIKEKKKINSNYLNAVADYEFEKSKNIEAIKYLKNYDILKKLKLPQSMSNKDRIRLKERITNLIIMDLLKNLVGILSSDTNLCEVKANE